MFMHQHLADCFQRCALRERDRRSEGVPRHVHRRIKQQTGVLGHLTQRHIHRPIVGFYWKDFITFKMQVFITLVNHFGDGEEFDPELRTRLLPFVDDPTLPVVVRMDIGIGKFHHVCMAQARKSAEDEDIPVDARSVVGKFYVHDGPQF